MFVFKYAKMYKFNVYTYIYNLFIQSQSGICSYNLTVGQIKHELKIVIFTYFGFWLVIYAAGKAQEFLMD